MKKSKKNIHFVHPYLINPTNPLKVYLIGAGGTGSTLLTALARKNYSLVELGHPGLDVSVIDPDKVNRANLGRQLFLDAELGMHKAVALVNRANRTFGTAWKALPEKFGATHHQASIFISCVDNVDTRFKIANILEASVSSDLYLDFPLYWMDFGNAKETGQVILSTVSEVKQPQSRKYNAVPYLPYITTEFSGLLKQSEKLDNTPSCSLAEALESQDLFINSTLANAGASLLWNMFRKGMVEHRGFFLNLKDFRMQPIPIPSVEKSR